MNEVPLQRELATYAKKLPELLAQSGKFALVKGDELIGVYDSYQDALTAGYKQFALDPFLVKRIAPTEQIAYFTRDLPVCLA